MHETASPSLPFWDQCVQELKVRRSRFRIRRHPGSPFIYVREMVAGRKLGEFSLKPSAGAFETTSRKHAISASRATGKAVGLLRRLRKQ